MRLSSCCFAYENYTRVILNTTKPSGSFGVTFCPSLAVLLCVMYLVPRDSVGANYGAVTYSRNTAVSCVRVTARQPRSLGTRRNRCADGDIFTVLDEHFEFAFRRQTKNARLSDHRAPPDVLEQRYS